MKRGTLFGLLLWGSCAIAQAGDETSSHWAFVRPVREPLPQVSAPRWSRGAIDRFVLAALERMGRRPSEEADRYTLARRVSFDLTGLPPTPEAVQSFVDDFRPGAYERYVDQLLGTPVYGERLALWWLDAVRFADTNGYEVDRPRSIWLYRDWVIEAFNRDLPFDQFAIEQLAGDLLPGATVAQRVATGFHRNSWDNEEGGHDWAQFRWEAVVDRLHTTSTVFLGLTVSCAQCHDHKYDPISQREYWELFAFLNNVDEPFLEVRTDTVESERQELLAEIAALEAERETGFPLPEGFEQPVPDEDAVRSRHLDERLAAWHRREAREARQWEVIDPIRYTSRMNATMDALPDRSLLVSGDRPEIDEYRVRYRLPPGVLRAVRLEALPHPSLPRHGPGRGSVMEDGSFALSEISATLYTAGAEVQVLPLALTTAAATHHRSKRTVDKAIDGNPLTSWHTQGGVGREQRAVFGLAEPVVVEAEAELEVVYLMNFVHQQTLGRFRLSTTDDVREVRAPPFSAAVLNALLEKPPSLTSDQRQLLRDTFLAHAEELAEQNQKIAELRGKLPPWPTTMVVEERRERRPTRLHTRGAFSRPAEEVQPGVPAVLAPLAASAPRNRLEFARWIASEGNPLTARVLVNHLWQGLFGRGLVATTEDFGAQGEPPSHPELLDWLATELVRRDWSLKEIERLIVLSATYRQVSHRAEDGFDPENRWLSRGSRYRLSAEAIRDAALAAGGMLSRDLGGPSVFPARPDSGPGFTYSGLSWPTEDGSRRYRRGLYTHRKRGSPFPALAAFDAPPRTTCVVRRERSNTPLQALALLNDETILDAARELARRVLSGPWENDPARMRHAFQICLTRPPAAEETKDLLRFLEETRARCVRGELDARVLAGVGEGEADQATVQAIAAWTAVARVLLNLDEAVTKE